MRAAVLRGGRLEVRETPDPVPGPGELLLKTLSTAVCASDIHYMDHPDPDDASGMFVWDADRDVVMGHEFVGEVVEVGEDVSGVEVGDRVTASPIVPCMECARCQEGRYNLCAVCWSTAIAYGRPGGFAELVQIPTAVVGANVFPLGSEVSDEAGALVEPLAVAVHAVRLTPRSRVPSRPRPARA